MNLISYFTKIVIWTGILVIKVSSSSLANRQSPQQAEDSTIIRRFERANPSNEVILRPFSGRGLPVFSDILFPAPCGQPKSGVKIAIDTGSSDFWIDARSWCECPNLEPGFNIAHAQNLCDWLDEHRKRPGEAIPYDDKSTVKGAFLTKDLEFGKEVTLKDITFLAAWDFYPPERFQGRNAPTGMVGLGYIRNQQSLRHDKYWTLPYVLENAKATRSNAFSMWFEDTGSNDNFEGSVFFGGYVKNYYKGTLTTFKIIDLNYLKKPTEIVIMLDRIAFKGKDAFFNCKDSLPVLLDTGTYSSWLPFNIFKRLVDRIGSNEIRSNSLREYAVIKDCTRLNLKDTLEFQIGRLKVPVPLSDIIRKVTPEEANDNTKHWLSEGSCVTHGIAAFPGSKARAVANGFAGSKPPLEQSDRHILGVLFLRHLFVLYDLSQNEVALALADQKAIREQKPQTFEFHDETEHQTQGNYRPLNGLPESCPLV